MESETHGSLGSIERPLQSPSFFWSYPNSNVDQLEESAATPESNNRTISLCLQSHRLHFRVATPSTFYRLTRDYESSVCSKQGEQPTGKTVSSVPEPLVHDIEKMLSAPESLKLCKEESRRIVQPVGRVVGAVGGQENILHGIEGMAFWQRFLIKNV